jgi:2-oxoglutarate dehydrogenase E2 component (dihydrolipoamide succinyltransferase)
VPTPAPTPAPAPSTPPAADAHGPAVRKLAAEAGVSPAEVAGSGKGGRVTKGDMLAHLTAGPRGARVEQRVPMTRIRARIAERLKEVQNTAAILTTFNEVNMQPVMDLRKKYQDVFTKKHGVKLGFMSFFVKAVTEALKAFPVINATVDGKDIVYHAYFDVGIAVSTERGLVVPILRDADKMSLAEIEKAIVAYGEKARAGKIGLDDLQGGTFSITNGGTFGSMLSTPILNAPQSAILGMHNIVERPVAENGHVVIRPVMYLALSYDHRIIDGAEAVQFLVKVRDALQDPARLLLEV